MLHVLELRMHPTVLVVQGNEHFEIIVNINKVWIHTCDNVHRLHDILKRYEW